MNILIELSMWIPVLIYIISVFCVSILISEIIEILIELCYKFYRKFKKGDE